MSVHVVVAAVVGWLDMFGLPWRGVVMLEIIYQLEIVLLHISRCIYSERGTERDGQRRHRSAVELYFLAHKAFIIVLKLPEF